MELELRHLRALLAVAEQGSFNQAASATDVSQPAVSKSIAMLERAIQAQLFERGPRGATITRAGEILARTAASALNIIENARSEIAALSSGDAARLVIGATPSTMAGLVPRACARLAAANRDISIHIREGLDADLLPALELGEIDILVGPVSDLHGCPSHLVERVLIEEALSIGVRPSHALSARGSVGLRDLGDASWILPTAGSRFHQLVEAMFSAVAMPWPKQGITTSDLAAQEMMALESDHILLLSDIQLVARRSPLICIPIENSPRRKMGWRRLAGVKPSGIQDSFTAYLGAVLAEALPPPRRPD